MRAHASAGVASGDTRSSCHSRRQADKHVVSYSRHGVSMRRLLATSLALVGQLPTLSRLFYSTGHSVQRERGFTAAAPHVIRQGFKRVRQDKSQEPHSVSPFVSAVSLRPNRSEPPEPKSWNPQPAVSVER